MTDEYVCLILAAGHSTRFGSPKMQYVLKNGLSILQSTVQLYTQVFSHVCVVIKPGNDILKHSLSRYSVTVLENSNAHLGLSQSINTGVSNIASNQGYVIALGDMPFIKLETLKMLKQATMNDTKGAIIALEMESRLGNPVAFSHTYRNQLLSLRGDMGARPIINHNDDCLVKVVVNDVGIFSDIDTVEDIPSLHRL